MTVTKTIAPFQFGNCKFQLAYSFGEEKVFVKYKNFKSFLPATVMNIDNYISICAAGVGKAGDIKVTLQEWFNILKKLGSVEVLNKWKEKLNIAA